MSGDGTFYKSVAVTTEAMSGALVPPAELRRWARRALVRSIRAATDAPVRFAVITTAYGWEVRGFAGDEAVKYLRRSQQKRKSGHVFL